MIVATAGHVDHGKTSLVRALTGVDADRLPEEKRRGLTIDLGFAYLPLEGGPAVGFVDVPGHERFVRNMLCGVPGIDLALLVVAADDGVMPQTREHLAILDLLGVARGVVAITKIDRVAAARVDEVAAEVRALLAGTALSNSPLFPVSSSTGEGIGELKGVLKEEAGKTGTRKARGNFRLSVDRCFTVAGAGLVVTGTAMSGAVAVGDEVRALLGGAAARVRGIHAQNAPAAQGRAGQRLALNLAGLKAPVARGDWIVAADAPPPVARFDARLRLSRDEARALEHWTPVHLHLGAADVTGRLALLEGGAIAPGRDALVQLVLDRPIGAVRGDGFIVRDQSARRTLGGGRVIDLFPPKRGRASPERLAWLRAMEIDDDERALEALAAIAPAGVDLARFAASRNLPAAKGRRFAPAHWQALRERALRAVTLGDPSAKGIPADVLPGLLEELVREGRLVREGSELHLPGQKQEASPEDAELWRRIEPLLSANALRPPTLAELAEALGEEPRRLEAALSRAAKRGAAVRVTKTRFFLPEAVRRLAEMLEQEADARGAITAAAFRDRSGIGRNLAIEVLEYFDRIKFTRRAGDAHVLVKSPGRESHPGGARGLQIR